MTSGLVCASKGHGQCAFDLQACQSLEQVLAEDQFLSTRVERITIDSHQKAAYSVYRSASTLHISILWCMNASARLEAHCVWSCSSAFPVQVRAIVAGIGFHITGSQLCQPNVTPCRKLVDKIGTVGKKDIEEVVDVAQLQVIIHLHKDQDTTLYGTGSQLCYHIMGLVHTKWAPIPGSIKDYIATPKTNGYQVCVPRAARLKAAVCCRVSSLLL